MHQVFILPSYSVHWQQLRRTWERVSPELGMSMKISTKFPLRLILHFTKLSIANAGASRNADGSDVGL